MMVKVMLVDDEGELLDEFWVLPQEDEGSVALANAIREKLEQKFDTGEVVGQTLT